MNTRDDKTVKNHRARWAAIGAAIAVSLGAGGLGIVNATSPAGASAYVGTEPCRLLDTRSATEFHIGVHGTLEDSDKLTVTARGDVGECTGTTSLPNDATALQLNVTPIGASKATNLRVYGGEGNPPNASNLNPAPGQRPIPNAVTVQLDDAGKFSIYNRFGRVDVAVDVVGYYTDHEHDNSAVEWINVNADGTVDSTSPGLSGASVRRPLSAPSGHFCIEVPNSQGLASDAAVASARGTAGFSPRTATVTAADGNPCNSGGNWFIAVETFVGDSKDNSSFTVQIPRT